jgi:hypothetical protein
MIQHLEQLLLDEWEKFNLNVKKPAKLEFLLYSPKKAGSNTKVSFFVISPSYNTPFAVAKFYANGSSSQLENCFTNLQWLHRGLRDSNLISSIPKPILLDDYSGHKILIESYLPGKQIASFVFNMYRRRYCLEVIKWITNFHLHTVTEVILNSQSINEYFNFYLVSYGNNDPDNHLVGKYLEEQASIVSQWQGIKLPLVCVHGDINTRNSLVEKGCIKVVDWELSKQRGLPLIDILHFFITYLMMMNNQSFLWAFKNVFAGTDKFVTNNWNLIMEYVQRLGLKKEFIEVLIGQYLLSYLSFTSVFKRDILNCLLALSRKEIKIDQFY